MMGTLAPCPCQNGCTAGCSASVGAGSPPAHRASSGSSIHGGVLHGGSQHNERIVARKLAALATTSGHGEVVVELAMRAASAVGLSPTTMTPYGVSREASNTGRAHFAEAMQSLVAAEQEDAATDDDAELRAAHRQL